MKIVIFLSIIDSPNKKKEDDINKIKDFFKTHFTKQNTKNTFDIIVERREFFINNI